jgi:C_GCAxxG_C_C family probable redox protein
VCQHLGIETDEEAMTRMAFGFAGGFGNTGAVCGAVAGGVMALGLGMERGGSMEEMMGSLATVGDFRRRFEAEMGSILCRELTGVDLGTEEGIAEFMSSSTPETVCVPAVETAYDLVVEILNEST